MVPVMILSFGYLILRQVLRLVILVARGEYYSRGFTLSYRQD